jgi:hypothetical protein
MALYKLTTKKMQIQDLEIDVIVYQNEERNIIEVIAHLKANYSISIGLGRLHYHRRKISTKLAEEYVNEVIQENVYNRMIKAIEVYNSLQGKE